MPWGYAHADHVVNVEMVLGEKRDGFPKIWLFPAVAGLSPA